ncbi:AAA family ATPase [bacterium]|nr:AAA family ATPase [bacterium]
MNLLESTFFGERLPTAAEEFLRSQNPWWFNKPMRPLPPFKRWLFDHTLLRLKSGLAPVTVLRGPRQVGKTTLQEQIIDHLINQEKTETKRIFRVQFDELASLKGVKDPILSISRWFENIVLESNFNEWAHNNKPIFLFFDEVQNLDNWAPQIKSLVDNHSVRILVTGSSALRIEHGRDSLAGRISTLELGTLHVREIASLRGWGEIPQLLPFNGLTAMIEPSFWVELADHGKKHSKLRDKAFQAFSENGGYPVAQARTDRPWEEIADLLNETIVRRVIQHDLRIGDRGRKRDRHLLEEIFRLSCRYAGQNVSQAIFVQELRAALRADVGWQRVSNYLSFLNDTLLIRLVQPLEIRIKRRKGTPKICLSDHSLRASWLQEIIPLTSNQLENSPHLGDLAGHLAESIVGYFLSGIPSLDLAWFPERSAEPEVDFVITAGQYRIPLEVKYRQRIDSHRDTLGLRAFVEKAVYNAPFGILVTLKDDVVVKDPRIIALPLSSLLLMR